MTHSMLRSPCGWFIGFGVVVTLPSLPVAAAAESAAGPAPWSANKIPAARAALTITEWRKAENRATCAPIALLEEAIEKGAKMRRANFHGGWAVAYDLPGKRSAFGVAGAGVSSEPGSFRWPNNIQWADGSRAGYGLEGGSGPNYLAYISIAGQGCLYNIWSALGKEHLERLLAQLRFVENGTATQQIAAPPSAPSSKQ